MMPEWNTPRAKSGPRVSGTAWQRNWHAVPHFAQLIEITYKLHPPVARCTIRAFVNKIRALRVTCSLLRQVCGLCGWNSRSADLQAPSSKHDGGSHLAIDLARTKGALVGRIVGAGLLAVLPGGAFAGDAWIRGSSFGSDVKHAAGWSQSGFAASPEVSWGAADVQGDHGSVSRFVFDPSLSPLANLRNLIAAAEAGAGGYDAVAYGADVSPPARASTLRLGEVRAWVQATPGQNHAIGRYQIIPKTFERLAKATASADEATFDRSLQDRWANVLIEEAGYTAFLGGDISPDVFMDRLAQIWAGLPLGDGRSPAHSPEVQATTGQTKPTESSKTENPDAGLLPQENIQTEVPVARLLPKRRSQVHTREKPKPSSANRYTLILKITPDLRDKLEALIGSSSPARRRLIMAAFSQSLQGISVPAEVTNPPDPDISWRLDLRLEDALVHNICAKMGRTYEPVATVLARFIAPKLASFIEERMPSQQVTHQQPESTLPD